MKSELLIKFLLEECTEKEIEQVANWIKYSDKNKKQFLAFKTIWDESRALKIKNPRNEELAWEKFKLKTEVLTNYQKRSHISPMLKIWQQIAAVLTICILGFWGYNQFYKHKYTEIVSLNKVSSETLPDGTILTLNKNAKISYMTNFKHNRKLKMEIGEVFFEVKKDSEHPFMIDIDKVSVEVLGTSFNIKKHQDFTQINVETGVVKVSLSGNDVTLFKGEQLIIKNGANQLLKEKYTDQLYNYYRTKLFKTNNIKLAELVITLNQAYGSNISLDERSKELTISTTLKMDSLEENIQIICETLNLSSSGNGNNILLSYKDK